MRAFRPIVPRSARRRSAHSAIRRAVVRQRFRSDACAVTCHVRRKWSIARPLFRISERRRGTFKGLVAEEGS